MVASGTIGIPVTLLMYGTVRLERGIYLDDIYILAYSDELNVDQSDNMQGTCQAFGVFFDGMLLLF